MPGCVEPLAHLVAIGGPPGGAKTPVALALARRHGLRLYRADTRTWAHRDRALADGVEAARRFEELAPSQRFDQPLDRLVEQALVAERGGYVLDDLAGLARSPLAVAEGSTLPASAVATGALAREQVLWLVPTARFQAARLAERPTAAGPARLYRHLRDLAEADAARYGLATVTVDGSLGLDELVEVVERHLRPALAAGPSAATTAERRGLLREVNEATIAQVRGYFARPWATGEAGGSVQAFVCECARPGCDAMLRRTVAAAGAGPVLAPGHR